MFTLEQETDSSAILDIIEKTNNSVFITGKAGTGKSTMLKKFRSNTQKNVIVLAPTGIAALNVNGETIHRFFRFPHSVVTEDNIKISRDKIELFYIINTIIIDEISMVRVDLIDGIDYALRQYRKNDKPFGGVQMVFFGDLFQLPPIVGDKAADEYIKDNYDSQYFFEAKVFEKYNISIYELNKIYRQTDEEFIKLLNSVRENKVTENDLIRLNANNTMPKQDNDYIFLTTTRQLSEEINIEKMNSIKGEKHIKKCSITGTFADNIENIDFKYPAPETLEIKVSSKIMMLNNDITGRWVNGSIGNVIKCEDDLITVRLDSKDYDVTRHTWKRMEYTYNSQTRKIEEKQVGTFTQFPMQLANAITIHKSQGMTFDKVIVDVGSNGTFTPGQAYVALSRCTTFNNLIVKSRINQSDIMIDPIITRFYNKLCDITDKTIVTQLELRNEFVKELRLYLEIQKRAGYRGAYKPIPSFENAMGLAKYNGPKAPEILRRLKQLNTIEYCIEALCIKKKYNELVPLDVRQTCIKKLRDIRVNFDDFQPENRP